MRIVVLFIALTFTSCLKDKVADIALIEPQIDCGGKTYSFSQDIQPIFINSCATTSCHNTIVNAGGFITENYAQISTNDVFFLQTIKHESGVIAMPFYSPKLPDSLILKIECWMQQGSQDN